ncbi:vgrg protein [Clostridium algoriphilum]|uniref:VgrG-related protein n=1 Tax=Clostridium algoriphilum TaxID=198347 RepID=UPI001CF328DE|nr:vgrg protein [Clostridium algoriphilum]MCB2293834.1 vgrg protein [Clostridium algoriphilum]
MTLSTDMINNALLKQYALQIKNNSNIANKKTSDVENEKSMQESAFQTMLVQMMDNSGNSMMAELMSTALSNQSSFSLDDSLSAISNFNTNVRGALKSLVGNTTSKDALNNSNGVGYASAKYESNINPGTISNTSGDIGGKSYGAWQFSSKTGSLDSFIISLKTKDKDIYSKLTGAKAKDGNKFGENFDATWTSIARYNKDKFLKLQQNSIKENYYDSAAQSLKSKYGFDISKKSEALKESLLSTVVQHGVGGALSVFSKLNLKNTDGNIINDLYNERQKVNVYFKGSSAEIKESVYNRFTREKQDMLNMVKGEYV